MLEVTTYIINKGKQNQHYGLMIAKNHATLRGIAPNNWKTIAGARKWAEEHGLKFIEK